MRTGWNAALAAALMLGGASAVCAQQGPKALEAKAGEAFRHAHSALAFPPTLAGWPRGRVIGMEQDQLDVAVDYGTIEQGEVFTFYVFRNVSGDVPVWFDRARWMIEHRDVLGKAEAGEAGAFVPPGRNEAAGLAASYALSGKGLKSTGVAVLPLGEWYVKLRASSTTRSPAELMAAMKKALAELTWPKTLGPAAAAVPVQPCSGALSVSGEAKLLAKSKDNQAASMMNALLGSVAVNAVKDKGEPPPRPPVWCRDAFQTLQAGAYRPDSANDSYLLAVSDAGRAISVEPDATAVLLGLEKKRKSDKPSYVVQFLLLPQTLTTASYDRMPPPEQAIAIVREGRFVSGVPSWGKDKGNINITMEPGK